MSTIEEKYEKSIEILQKAFEILKLFIASSQTLEIEFKELKRELIQSNLKSHFSDQLENITPQTNCLNENSNVNSSKYSEMVIIKDEPINEGSLFSFGLVDAQQENNEEQENQNEIYNFNDSEAEIGIIAPIEKPKNYNYFLEIRTTYNYN